MLSQTQTAMLVALGFAASGCAGEPPSGAVSCETNVDCTGDLEFCLPDENGHTFCYKASELDAANHVAFCDIAIARYGESALCCNDFQGRLLDEPGAPGDFWCVNQTCPTQRVIADPDDPDNYVFESTIGPDAPNQKSEIACGLALGTERYEVSFRYGGLPPEAAGLRLSIAKLWTNELDGLGQIHLETRDKGAQLIAYSESNKPSDSAPINFDASESAVDLHVRVDRSRGTVEVFVNSEAMSRGTVSIEIADDVAPHIGLQGSSSDALSAHYDNFLVREL